MSTFRLLTLNAHSFAHPSILENTSSKLASILCQYDLDLIAVQEIQNDNEWKQFRKDLSLPHSIYGQCWGDLFGNGIASRHPISFYANELSNEKIRAGRRSMLQCRLEGNHPFVQNRTFAVTHLDHIDEDIRLKQIKQFDPIRHQIDILLGDMNAFTRDDYSDQYYHDEIVAKREESQWEQPRFDVTKLITEEWGYEDVYRLYNPENKDQQVATCRFQTRIDYIYVHPRVNDEWIVKQCHIIDTQGFTDHQAVFTEFELKSR